MARSRKKPVTVADLTAKHVAKEAVEEAEEFLKAKPKASPKARSKARAKETPSPARPSLAQQAQAESAYRFVADNWERPKPSIGKRRLNVVRLAKTAVRMATDARRFYAQQGALGSARWLAGRGMVWLMRKLP